MVGSLLQWRWQWASIGHFVFLFPSQFHSKRCSLLLTMKSDFSHQISENMKSYFRNHFSEIRLQTSMLEMSLANRFKNLYRGQLFIFCLRRRFFLKISLLEMLIAVGNEHLKRSLDILQSSALNTLPLSSEHDIYSIHTRSRCLLCMHAVKSRARCSQQCILMMLGDLIRGAWVMRLGPGVRRPPGWPRPCPTSC